VLFRTSDDSYHGLPRPITCPEGTQRNSLAIYYVSRPRQGVAHRPKAMFVGVREEGDPHREKRQRLRQIRAETRITKEDLEQIWPNWEQEHLEHIY
jgi:hypothetical protein